VAPPGHAIQFNRANPSSVNLSAGGDVLPQVAWIARAGDGEYVRSTMECPR
jgi:hypothetical protein